MTGLRIEWSIANAEKERSEEEVELTLAEMSRVLRWFSSRISRCHFQRLTVPIYNASETSMGIIAVLLDREMEYRQMRMNFATAWSHSCLRNELPIPRSWRRWARLEVD